MSSRPKNKEQTMRKFLAWFALVLGLFAFVAHFVTPWPSVWAIRAVFDSGAAAASEKLEKHLPDNINIRSAVRYDANDADALLDIYSPEAPIAGAPVVVWIHGGGFVSGRRSDIANYLKILAGRGFVVVNVDYTVAPQAIYPTPTRQLANALAYLEGNAASLGIVGGGYVLAGDSAGSQIAAQLANVITSPSYAAKTGIAVPIAAEKLKGALLHCGVYDVSSMNAESGGVLGWFMRTVTWSYSGHRNWRDAKGFETFSVANYLTPQFPPTFISVGNADPLAPQTILMDQKLREQGVKVDSLFFPKEYQPSLSHEYQFDIDTAAGQQALDRSVAWLSGLK
ncbi:MAG: alpha/beta hydrolase [Sphingomonadaceae bacterium]|nr:alpha/beta hydrolase [Sphingomonadaceae bacterium]